MLKSSEITNRKSFESIKVNTYIVVEILRRHTTDMNLERLGMGLFFLIKLKVDGNLINVDACCSVDLGGFFIELFIGSFSKFLLRFPNLLQNQLSHNY